MTLKTARRGNTKGQQFWGCTEWPRCRNTLSYQPRSEPYHEQPPPTCDRCNSPMTRRTARKGEHKGKQFWGCTRFPKCRYSVPYRPTVHTQPESDTASKPTAEALEQQRDKPEESPPPNQLWLATTAVLRFVENIRTWYLELREPDANGNWPERHHQQVLRFLWFRDGERCGLCGGRIKKLYASNPERRPQIEHIIPKVFAVFDLDDDGKARPGTTYKSRLHKMNNLQAAHSYCNKRKGNTADISKWRHPSMRRLPVARSRDGKRLFLPGLEEALDTKG